jgi:hypothetical protein
VKGGGEANSASTELSMELYSQLLAVSKACWVGDVGQRHGNVMKSRLQLAAETSASAGANIDPRGTSPYPSRFHASHYFSHSVKAAFIYEKIRGIYSRIRSYRHDPTPGALR